MLPFTQQMRAADDPEWANVLSYFRNPSASMTPIAASNILSFLRPLSADDVAADELWHDAVIVTGANITRFAINKAQAFRFARRANQPVIAWPLRLESKTQLAFQLAAQRNSESVDAVRARYDIELVFYFVRGMCHV
jgi:hypothetical protein